MEGVEELDPVFCALPEDRLLKTPGQRGFSLLRDEDVSYVYHFSACHQH